MENFGNNNLTNEKKGETKMAHEVNINTKTEVKNTSEFTVEYQDNGNGACIPVINGNRRSDLMFGYTSEADKNAAINLITSALKAADGNEYLIGHYMYEAMMNTAEGIRPEEQIEVDGVPMMIDYNTSTIYELNRIKVADLSDITTPLTKEVAKAMLIDRAKLWLAENETEDDEDWYEDDDDYEW